MSIIGFLPQAIKTIRTRKTRDLSLASWSVLFVGSILWLIYGFNKSLLPVILVNSVLAVSSTIIIFIRLRFNES
jgi:MtN3 and saliva related transmembrane protein